MKLALVLSAETPSAVATVRGLHDAGFEVAALAESRWSPATASWRCTRPIVCGGLRSDELVSIVLDHDVDLVVPVTEGDLVRVAPVRQSVERLVPVLAPPADVLARATDKWAAVQAAEAIDGVTVAERALIPHDARIEGATADDFPAVAKPSRSKALLPDGRVFADTARFVHDQSDLRRAHADFAKGGCATIVERPVTGTPILVSLLLDEDGEMRRVFVHRRVRQSRPSGGPSACAISHVPDDSFVGPAVELARALELVRVPVQFEFLVPTEGDPVLLDVNPRPWGTLGLAQDCGVDFVGAAARHALGEPLEGLPPEYEAGVLRHYLPFEISHLMARMTGNRPAGRDVGGVLDALVGWAYPPAHGLLFRLDDPLPACADVVNVFRAMLLREDE